MDLQFTFIDNLKRIPASDWQTLGQDAGPFLDYVFLGALEAHHCVGGDSGWQPCHLTVKDALGLLAALPLYQKSHSYGEYVFDFAWAEAFSRYGKRYYPKLVSALPFTPVPGQRLLTRPGVNAADLWPAILEHLQTYCNEASLSSLHVLFPHQEEAVQLAELGAMQRHSVQFHWFNRGYKEFADFTATFSSRKRKNLLKERRRLLEAGISFHRLTGCAITAEHMQDFYLCYQHTYLKRSGHTGYLNSRFFEALRQNMSERLLLVQARINGDMLASALFFTGKQGLFGRYWGCMQEVDGLHFEVCYYQGIEYCIEHGLPFFNPGTQGEHKIQRGFEPVLCFSNHWLADNAFHTAVQNYVAQEKLQMAEYYREASKLLPYSRQNAT